MCSTNLTGRTLGLLAVAALACVPIYAQGDPPGCSASGVTLEVASFACNPDSTCASSAAITGSGPVVIGQHIMYQTTLLYPGGATCAFSGGTLSITLPNGTVVNVTTGGTVQTSVPAGGTSMTGTCLGCTTTHTGVTTTGSGFVSATVPYTVSAGDVGKVNAGEITATASYGGGTLWDSATGDPGPAATTPYNLRTSTCGATVDKQVSCNGTTWYDVTGTDDTAGSTAFPGSTDGVVCTSGGTVHFQYVVTPAAGSGAITCSLSDSKQTIAGGTGSPSTISTGVVTTSPKTFTSSAICSLTGNQSGQDTASLASCSCPTPQGTTVSLAGTISSDTATYFCASDTVDKQVSCDGAAFVDVGQETANGDGTNGCISTAGGNGTIQVQWAAQNTGNIGLTCTLGESNGNFVPTGATGFTLSAGTTSSVAPVVPIGGGPVTNTGLSCVQARSFGGSLKEPNTATLSCTPNVSIGIVDQTGDPSVYDTATFDCCGVEIEKQVSCNGGAFTNTGFQTAGNLVAGNSCSALLGQPVAIQYQIQNTGSLALQCSGTATITSTGDPAPPLGLSDVYVSSGNTVLALTSETLAVGATSSPIANPNVTSCTAALNTGETMGNKAAISCVCNGIDGEGTVPTAAYDIAQIQCANPAYTYTKSCPSTGPTTFNSDVTVTNTGNVPLSCTVVDQTVPGVCVGTPSCSTPLSGGTAVSISGQPLSVAVSASPQSFSSATITATSTVCNQACVSCTTTGPTPVAVTPPGANTAAEATCNVGTGCIGLSPGFWKHHLALTDTIIAQSGGSIQSCGMNLTNTNALTNQSTVADLCTNPGSLEFQCAAAALNLAGSQLGGLSCEGADPGITAAFNSCCGAGGTCAKGLTGTPACDQVAAFAGMFENTPIPAALGGSNGPNVTGPCKTDQQSDFENSCNASSTPGIPTCGTGRVYPSTKNGK